MAWDLLAREGALQDPHEKRSLHVVAGLGVHTKDPRGPHSVALLRIETLRAFPGTRAEAGAPFCTFMDVYRPVLVAGVPPEKCEPEHALRRWNRQGSGHKAARSRSDLRLRTAPRTVPPDLEDQRIELCKCEKYAQHHSRNETCALTLTLS